MQHFKVVAGEEYFVFEVPRVGCVLNHDKKCGSNYFQVIWCDADTIFFCGRGVIFNLNFLDPQNFDEKNHISCSGKG